MKSGNVIRDKSYNFAIRVVNLFKYLKDKKKEFVLSKQILRSGTSIGANVEEAIGAQSTNDFVSKLSIAYKEARETIYWINLLKDTGYIEAKDALSLYNDCEEICKIISKIQITLKKNKDNS